MCLYYVEAGKDGLKKAEENYDPKADFSFDSYAVWWIRQRIIQAIESKK
jgi:RNA polymerase primary sigma factor